MPWGMNTYSLPQTFHVRSEPVRVSMNQSRCVSPIAVSLAPSVSSQRTADRTSKGSAVTR